MERLVAREYIGILGVRLIRFFTFDFFYLTSEGSKFFYAGTTEGSQDYFMFMDLMLLKYDELFLDYLESADPKYCINCFYFGFE